MLGGQKCDIHHMPARLACPQYIQLNLEVRLYSINSIHHRRPSKLPVIALPSAIYDLYCSLFSKYELLWLLKYVE